MPYLKITCPALNEAQYTIIAQGPNRCGKRFIFNPKARLTREELRNRTTVHFVPYKSGELYIGGKTPAERTTPDVTIELSDWYMSVKQQRKVAQGVTPIVAQLFNIAPDDRDNINIRFHSYPPTDFAVGGKLLSDRIPYIGRLLKRLFE